MYTYGVKKAYLFGSYARNEAKPNSDVDIFIEGLDSSIRLGIGHLYLDLKGVLDKEIDLVESEAKHNQQFLGEIKKDFVRLF